MLNITIICIIAALFAFIVEAHVSKIATAAMLAREGVRAEYAVALIRARRDRAKAFEDCVYWSDRVKDAYGVQFEVVMYEREKACTKYHNANTLVQSLVYDATAAYALIK